MAYISRRKFMLSSAAMAGTIATTLWVRSQLNKQNNRRVLSSIIDTLIPSDEVPGALDIGLDMQMEDEMHTLKKVREQMARVVTMVDKKSLSQHRRSFDRLNIDQRETLIMNILGEGKQYANQDMLWLRRKINTWFYESNAGRQSIAYQLPAHYPAYTDV